MDLILAIAALCQLNTGGTSSAPERVQDYQTVCQAYYAKCVKNEGKPLDSDMAKLLACMEKRK